MKNASSEPPTKKLKQARLPFQSLSPSGPENPVASQQQQRKRKASEVPKDNNIVNEPGQLDKDESSPLEKKLKVSESAVKNKTLTKKSTESEGAVESTETDDIKIASKPKRVLPKTPNSTKRKRTNTKKPTSSHKTTKPNSSEKAKNPKKKQNIREKTPIKKNSEQEPQVVDLVDLCDSPCKTGNISTKNSESKTSENIVCTVTDEEAHAIDGMKNNKREDSNILITTSKTSVAGIELEKENGIENSISKDSLTSVEPSQINDSKDITEDKCVTPDKESLIKNSDSKEEKSDAESVHQEPKDKTKVNIKDMIAKMSSKLSKTENMKKSECDNLKKPNVSESLDTSTPAKGSVGMHDDLPEKATSSPKDCTLSDISISSESSPPTSSGKLKNPASSKKHTPRRMTPKQLLKLKEKEEKREERERLKQEKEMKRNAEKEEKNRLKQEKEEERKKEKEEKERKRLAEIAKKEEEKKVKDEEKRVKEEEKRIKEEEKRKKDEEDRQKKEEKRLKEEQKEAGKRKSAQAFANFFLKAETPKTPTAIVESETMICDLSFQPFEVKNDMRLAPVQRSVLSVERRSALDGVVGGEAGPVRSYLEEVRSPSYEAGAASRTWPPDLDEDDVIIIESENPNQEMETDQERNEKKTEKRKKRAKLLQFHENRRPPYWGTWCKRSKLIRPRAPLNMDKAVFEYEVDSDEEWEEPEDGESLRGSEDEESQDEQYEEDNDMFVPHGYLSDEEGQDELDDKSPEAMKAKLKFLQMEFEAERNEKQEKLKPRLIGCVWFSNSLSDPSVVGSHIAELFLARRAVWEGSLPLTITRTSPLTTSVDNNDGTPRLSKGGVPKRYVPDSMIPDVIKKVHGSRKKLTKLLLEILDEQVDKSLNPSKKCLAMKIREIAIWECNSDVGHYCWYVKDEVRKEHDLLGISIESIVKPKIVPPSPKTEKSPAANITKFTKVLTSEERLKLLREPPSACNNSSSDTLNHGVGADEKKGIALSCEKPKSIFATPTVKTGTHLSFKKRVTLFSVRPGQPLPPSKASSVQPASSTGQVSEPPKNVEAPLSSVHQEKTLNDLSQQPPDTKSDSRVVTKTHSSSIQSEPATSQVTEIFKNDDKPVQQEEPPKCEISAQQPPDSKTDSGFVESSTDLAKPVAVQKGSPKNDTPTSQPSGEKKEKSSITNFFKKETPKDQNKSQGSTPLKETSKSTIVKFFQKKPTADENKPPSSNAEEPGKSNEKIKKRIKPITLTNILPKPAKVSTEAEEECVVLSD